MRNALSDNDFFGQISVDKLLVLSARCRGTSVWAEIDEVACQNWKPQRRGDLDCCENSREQKQ